MSPKKQIKEKAIVQHLLGIALSLLTLTTGCKKFLDEKPNITDVVPHSLNDLQTLLDNTSVLNSNGVNGYAELVADNYYVATADYQSMASANNRFLQSDAQNYIW